MRYRLRTLLILLAVGPPLLALAWSHGKWIAFALGCLGFEAVFVLWYWMLCRSQAMRGKPNYDPPSVVPPPN
jgi:hypothetical protein